jgi:uncharacterized protein YndB with AHSA1/START domain
MSLTENIKIEVQRFIQAPRERVWKTWSDPEQIKNWLEFGGSVKVESVKLDLRVGGKFRTQFRMADGEFFTAAGTYLEIKPLERLVYNWDWEKDGSGAEFGELEGNESQVTVEFHPSGQGTELVLTHEQIASPESRDRHQEGWEMWMEKVANYLEEK